MCPEAPQPGHEDASQEVPVDQINRLTQEFDEYLSITGKLSHTRDSYCRDSRQFLTYFFKYFQSLEQSEPQTLVHYQDYLREHCHFSQNSVRRSVIAIRMLFRFFTTNQKISTSPFDHVAIPQRLEINPEKITTSELDLLLECCHRSHDPLKNARDKAILSLLAFDGLKVNEMISLKWNDFLNQDQFGSIRIKGNRGRLIQLSSSSYQEIKHYLNRVSQKDKSLTAPQNHVFISFRGRDLDFVVPKITRHGVKFMLYEIGEKAGIKKLNAETLRHHAIENLLERGFTNEEVMAHLGLRTLGNISKHQKRHH